MIKAYRGQKYGLTWASDFAEEHRYYNHTGATAAMSRERIYPAHYLGADPLQELVQKVVPEGLEDCELYLPNHSGK